MYSEHMETVPWNQEDEQALARFVTQCKVGPNGQVIFPDSTSTHDPVVVMAEMLWLLGIEV